MGISSKNKDKESSADNNEYAKIIDWPLKWDTSAPMPQVYGNGHKTFLL